MLNPIIIKTLIILSIPPRPLIPNPKNVLIIEYSKAEEKNNDFTTRIRKMDTTSSGINTNINPRIYFDFVFK